MKKQKRYKILHYAKDQYNKDFDMDFQFTQLSRKELHNLLKQYRHSSMYEWDYCCRGLYQSCWEDPYEEGVWDLSQKEVDLIIADTINEYARYYRKDNRILYHESDNMVRVILVMRDIFKADFLIVFTNEEY